jgi:hypothetical protein
MQQQYTTAMLELENKIIKEDVEKAEQETNYRRNRKLNMAATLREELLR